mmetsp:Transcript_5306/g.8038  ORF Transcript_5306/g.8038 Transcript_5306/m.8038 type:complete len:390 (-) Transcript_5306:549-1718(-)
MLSIQMRDTREFLFALVDKDGDHAAEMDSKNDNSRRSFPIVSGVTFIKSNHTTGTSNGFMQIREGGGGEFYNTILTGIAGAGLENNKCFSETRSTSTKGTAPPDYLFWSSNNIVNTISVDTNAATQFKIAISAPDNCIWPAGEPVSRSLDPQLQLVPNSWTSVRDLFQIDPRPVVNGNAYSGIDVVSDPFFTSVSYSGAFGSDLWLDHWSYLSVKGLLPANDVMPTSASILPSRVTADTTLSGSSTYYMTQQVFVVAGVTLTIEAGTTIRSYRQDSNGKAPTLVIERGAKLIAEGTAKAPITCTTVLPDSVLPKRGTWGGLILLGNAIVTSNTGVADILRVLSSALEPTEAPTTPTARDPSNTCASGTEAPTLASTPKTLKTLETKSTV